jgi:Mn2+/Fe2+ NRAMP family transporter
VGKPFRDAPAFFVLYTFLLLFGAVVVLIPGLDPIGLILSSQYLQGLLLPIVLFFMWRLVNNRRLLGRYANGPRRNALAALCIGLVVLLNAVLIGSTLLSAVGIRLA